MDGNTKQKTKKRNHLLYDFVKLTGALPALIWMRPKVHYMTKKQKFKGGMLVASNHTGFTDPIKCMLPLWYRRVNSLATANLYDTKLKNWFFNQMHCIKVDKENFNMETFHQVTERLNQNKLVLIFPEGGINAKSEHVMSFKSGAILMAHKTGKPVLPMYVSKQKKWWHRVHIIIGDPIDVSSMCGKMPTLQQLNEISAYVRKKEIELEEYYFNSLKKDKTIEKGE